MSDARPGSAADGVPVTDVRLLPAAAACWITCFVAVAQDAVAVTLLGAGSACLVVLAAGGTWWRRRSSSGPAGVTDRGFWTVWLAGAAATTALVSCAAQLVATGSGLLPVLVADRAVVEVVGVVVAETTSAADPWADAGPPDGPGTSRYRTVLAVESVAGRGGRGAASADLLVLGGPEWSGMPYGARVQVSGRLAGTAPGDELRGVLVTWAPVVELDPPGAVDRGVAMLRTALLAVTDDLPPDARGLVPGAAIGDVSRIPPDLEQAMREVGLTHVTAVSGGHFAILSVTVLALTTLLRLPRTARAAVVAVVMGGFVLLVHPGPSVVRAAAMGAVATAGLVAGRRAHAVPALAATVVVLLVLDPWLARSFGFVLSVVATAAIVLLAPPLARRLATVVPRGLALALAVPAAAQAACGPVLVLLDPAVSLYAVPANLLAAPALVPATLLGVGATVMAPWAPAAGGLVADLAALATWWIATVARATAALPGARVPWPEGVGGATTLAAATAVVLAIVLLGHRLGGVHLRPVVVVGLCAVLLLVPQVRARVGDVVPGHAPPDDWRVVMCDVGQGDALVLRSGPDAAVVIDVGPDGPAADRCLDDLGIRRIDLLVLTHHHADHVGGLVPVLSGRAVVRAVVSPLPEPAGQARRTLEALARAEVRVQVALAPPADGPGVGRSPDVGTAPEGHGGEVVHGGVSGEVRWTVLWPREDLSPAEAEAATLGGPPAGDVGRDDAGGEINDSSVVLLLEAPGVSVLALGDIEPPAQEELVRLLPAGARAPDVLKVAHHGSAHQSTDLTAHLTPAIALISAGADNTYGHPAPSTTAELRARGALVLATPVCGRIVVVAPPGQTLEVTAACLDPPRA